MSEPQLTMVVHQYVRYETTTDATLEELKDLLMHGSWDDSDGMVLVERVLITDEDGTVLHVSEPAGVELTRGQLDAWAGRTLSDDEVEELDEAIPNSSIPQAIGEISDHLPSKNALVDSRLCEEAGAHRSTTRHSGVECPFNQED